MRTEESSGVFLVARARLRFGENIRGMLCAFQMFQLDHLGFDLFYKEAEARHVVANLLVISGKGLSEADGALVIDEENRR